MKSETIVSKKKNNFNLKIIFDFLHFYMKIFQKSKKNDLILIQIFETIHIINVFYITIHISYIDKIY